MEIWKLKVTLTKIILLTILNICQSRLCLKDPKCYCNTSKQGSTITCYNVVEVLPINDLLKNYTHIYSLRIYGRYLKSLPNNCFSDQSISVLEFSSPIINIPDDALTSIRNLQILNFNGTLFSSIPKGVTLPALRTLEMTHGSLESIDSQFETMIETSSFLLNNNKIRNIAGNAFSNSTSMNNLDLSYNFLTVIDSSTFSNAKTLKSLNLINNELLTVDGMFQNLYNLESLELYDNNLSKVENAFVQEMISLKILDLGGNLNLNISGSDFKMTKLETLKLNDNQFENLDTNLIKKFNQLKSLELNRNNLTSIPKDFFSVSRFIRNIQFSSNYIKSLKSLFSFSNLTDLPYLKYLSVDRNEISSIDIDDSFRHLTHLDLSRNQINIVRQMDFTNLTAATSLNLSGNPLSEIDTASFATQQKLRSLDLSNTNIKTLNQSLINLNAIFYLRITSSSLKSVDNEFKGLKSLEYVYLDGNNIASISNAFSDLVNLTALDLARNNLTTMTNNSFPSVQNKPPSLQKMWLEGNPWSCDCRLLWLLEWLKNNHSKLEDEPLCLTPSHLQGIPIRSLNESILVEWKEYCPQSCDCKCIVTGETIATTVDCSNRHLTNKPNEFPKNVKNIDMSGNNLASFIGFKIMEYPQLGVLNLENNGLLDVQLELSTSKIDLYLSQNKLHKVPFEEWNSTNIKSITLSKNPWICGCKTWNFKQWLLSYSLLVKDLYEIRCGDNGPLNNQIIINLSFEDLCPGIPKNNLNIIVAAIGLVVLFILCFLMFIFRKILATMLFGCGCHCVKPKEEHDYSFDAFLLYADEDDEFVLGVITEGLEADSKGYRLFVPTREVLLTSSPVSINSSIADCCKVIVVLTSNFLRSSQCMQLLKTAMACSLEKSSHRFIFITTDNIPLELELDAVLTCLVKKSVCLNWGECFFWTKLKFNLPKKFKVVIGNDEDSERLL